MWTKRWVWALNLSSESLSLSLFSSLNDADRKSTRLNSSHTVISYAVFCLKKKKKNANVMKRHEHQQKHLAAVCRPCQHMTATIKSCKGLRTKRTALNRKSSHDTPHTVTTDN